MKTPAARQARARPATSDFDGCAAPRRTGPSGLGRTADDTGEPVAVNARRRRSSARTPESRGHRVPSRAAGHGAITRGPCERHHLEQPHAADWPRTPALTGSVPYNSPPCPVASAHQPFFCSSFFFLCLVRTVRTLRGLPRSGPLQARWRSPSPPRQRTGMIPLLFGAPISSS